MTLAKWQNILSAHGCAGLKNWSTVADHILDAIIADIAAVVRVNGGMHEHQKS